MLFAVAVSFRPCRPLEVERNDARTHARLEPLLTNARILTPWLRKRQAGVRSLRNSRPSSGIVFELLAAQRGRATSILAAASASRV
jgi:hypothetical protein